MPEESRREGFEPTPEDKLRALFNAVEPEYDILPYEKLSIEPPEELLQKMEKLMRDEKFEIEAGAKKRAIRWWGDYKERRLRT